MALVMDVGEQVYCTPGLILGANKAFCCVGGGEGGLCYHTIVQRCTVLWLTTADLTAGGRSFPAVRKVTGGVLELA